MTRPSRIPPVLCLYTTGSNSAAEPPAPIGLPDELPRFIAPPQDDSAPACAALRACAAAHPGRDILLLASETRLPTGAWRRLEAAATLPFDILSPLSAALPAFDPFDGVARPDALDDADACVYAVSEREPVPVAHWSPGCALWHADALAQLTSDLRDGEVPAGLQAALVDGLYVADSARLSSSPDAATPAAIAVLRQRIAALGGRIPVAAGRDDRPVLLHVLHGWGGGVQHFVESLMHAGHSHRHLALVAHGNSERHVPGESLALYDDLGAAPLAEWPLALGIDATALASLEYRAVLQRIIARFGVGQILVSSLIGHGMEALRTGLPTSVVCHDYYPLWPLLHADFGDAHADFSPTAIEAALKHPGNDFQFAETRPAVWRRLREGYVTTLLETKATLFCPSHTVHANLTRIEPRLAELPWQQIPHGMAAWPEPVQVTEPPARDGLRVLVLGRINGGKGEDLLAGLMPLRDPRIEFLMLGAGRAGMRFFGETGVHLRMDYQRDELPDLIRQFAPDLALIPVTVAETFSYTLSELWSLGVPVLATRIGALAERIVPGENGLLAEPEPQAVAAALAALCDDPSPLAALRRAQPQPSLEQMAGAYTHNLPAIRPPELSKSQFSDPVLISTRNTLELAHYAATSEINVVRTRLWELQHEVEKRTTWADDIQEQLDERTEWAKTLESTLETERKRIKLLAHELDDRLEWAKSLETDLGKARAHANSISSELDNRTAWAKSLETDLKKARSDVSTLTKELQERTSWATLLDFELKSTRQQFQSLYVEFEDRTRWALALQEEVHLMNNEMMKLSENWKQDRERLEQAQLDLQTTTDELASVQASLHQQNKHIANLISDLASAMAHGETMQRDRDAILASRSWRMTRPLRHANRLVGKFLARIKFRTRRMTNLWCRTLISLRNRGLRGTWQRIRQELRPAPQVAPVALPDAGPGLDTRDISLPVSEQPRVSVVIPVYNHLDATLVCLRSLAQTSNITTHEIIVVDDCSSDDSATVLPKITGLRYQRNAKNLGFIGACNAGAESARGEYVVFLNNDTAVQDGWLDALIGTFGEHRDVGLVGAKLVYPDGRLQEAGGIVFADGSGWNYGRFDDPAKPEYNFVREVDYCSGAAIALRTDLFRRFGGFDAHYAPAYYEDTDLAMKVRQAGLRVLYQPASVVVHFEGVSSGTDTSSGTKRYQVVNKEKFFERWKDALASHPDPARTSPTDIALARQHRVRGHALVIDATTPQPDHDSGSVRLCNILRLLLEDGQAVTFFADNRAWVERYTAALQQMGVEVLWHPYLSDPVEWFERNAARFGLIFVSRHYIASNYVDLARRHAPRAILAFDTVDLHYLREQRAAELAGSNEMARSAEKTREQELRLIRECDVTLVVSPVEQKLLAEDAPGARVEVLSNVHEIFGRRRPFSERADIMFIGGYQHPPNIDAAVWFASEILPRIRAEIPELRFHLIGSKAPAEVKALAELPGVVFHGFVEDIEPFLDGCRLAVAPLRYGAGVKGKVNMSMSYGQPVVGTGIAVEGMYAESGRDVLVAETPEDFAAQVIRAYRDEALWTQLSDNGIANVQRHFSFDSALAALRRLLGEAG